MITVLNSVMRTSVYRLVARLVLLLTLLAGTTGTAFAQTVTYFHNDIAGTPQVATNAAGAVVWKENYLPYGYRQVADPASSGNKLWFTGKAYDPDTQLSYMGARYYMPLLGRFTGIDPAGLVPEQPHSFNRYAYANNNPYKFVDPDGKTAVLAYRLGLAVLAIAGANYLTPERRAQMEQAGALFKQRTSELLDRASGLVFSEGADKPADIVAPGGVPVGENIVGAKPGVQTVPPDKLTDIIDRLKGTGAIPDPSSRYPGDWYNLPGNQGGFGVRDSRDNGRTVDVNIPGVPDVTKIHER